VKLWFRVEADASTDTKIAQLGDALRIAVPHAFGLTVGVWCGVARHAEDGDLRDVADASLETWAGWTGKRGRFAAEFRRLFVDPNGELHGWCERQGALIAAMVKDRERHRKKYEEDQRKRAGISQENPRSLHGLSVPTITTTVQNSTEVVVIGAEIENAIPNEPTAVATLLTAAANQGITAKYGEQPNPLRFSHPGSLEVAEAVMVGGVPVMFARDAIYSAAFCCTLKRPPSSLKYFLRQVLDAWDAEQSKRQAHESPTPNRIAVTNGDRKVASLSANVARMLRG